MSYPLYEVHKLIDELIYSEAVFDEKTIIVQKAIMAAEAFPCCFMQQAAAVKDNKALRVLVHTTQAASTGLLNRLHDYKAAIRNDSVNKESGLQNDCMLLEEKCISNWLFLQQHFPKYIAQEQQLPAVLLSKEQKKLGENLQCLIVKWEAQAICPGLQTLVLAPVRRFLQAQPGPNCNLYQVAYFNHLVNSLLAVSNNLQNQKISEAIIDCLLLLNFNDPALLQYIMQYWYRQISTDMLPQDQALRWALYEKKLAQAYMQQLSLMPGSTSAKAALLNMIQQEIKYLGEQQKSLTAIYSSQSAATPKTAILTSLSVSQLAVCFRLLTDCKIIEHSNQAELLRMVASALKTSRATQISADSLRTKFYSPEQAAINIVKEYLHQMLTHLRKY